MFQQYNSHIIYFNSVYSLAILQEFPTVYLNFAVFNTYKKIFLLRFYHMDFLIKNDFFEKIHLEVVKSANSLKYINYDIKNYFWYIIDQNILTEKLMAENNRLNLSVKKDFSRKWRALCSINHHLMDVENLILQIENKSKFLAFLSSIDANMTIKRDVYKVYVWCLQTDLIALHNKLKIISELKYELGGMYAESIAFPEAPLRLTFLQ